MKYRRGVLKCKACGKNTDNYILNAAPGIVRAGAVNVYPCPSCLSLETTWHKYNEDEKLCQSQTLKRIPKLPKP